jgi:hypothetical protein
MGNSAHSRTQLRTISMILTVAFDNKCDQIDEADCMFIFQIKHQYSFWIIAHILFNDIYGMNKGKVFISCVLYTNGYVNVNEWMLFQF